MQKPDSLIRTKLRLPFTRPGLVSRPRLKEQVVQGLCGPLTLIIAPAGFGKTTLAASCVANCEMPVAWLSLDKTDNQAGRFLTYLIAALQAADIRIGGEAGDLIAGIQQPPQEAVLTSLINDLDSANTEIALVLDDYQLINSQAVHDAVAFLLQHCPNTFHLVIATRSDPPLPMARLRARGQSVELRAADLRFTESEAALFLNDVMGLHLDAGSVAALEERTEGWIAGLQMAALSMRDRKDVHGFIEGFSGTNRHILDYLLEEILTSQSPEIQHFLLCTSILDRLAAPLCDAILERDERAEPGDENGGGHLGSPPLPPSASVLEYLERENLFLLSLDDERIWFRYHHLFADLLRARLQLSQPDFVPLLHIRASDWLEQNEFIPEAIQHLFAAHEYERAADLIERWGSVYWVKSDPSIVQMADSLPSVTLLARPRIGLYQAWLLIIQGHIEKALPLLNDLFRQLAGESPNSGQQWILTIIGLALAFLGRRASNPGFDPLPDDQALDQIPAEDLIMRDTAEILYGMAMARRGEIDHAAEAAVKFMQRDKPSHDALTIPTIVPFLARIYLMQGRLHAAAALCRQYLDPIKEKGVRFITAGGDLYIALGEALYQWNCLDEAEKYIRDGLKVNEPWENVMTDGWGLLALTQILVAKADYAGAIQIVGKFETRLQGTSKPIEFEEDFRTLRINVQVAFGDLENTAHWAEQIQQSEDFHLHKERYQLPLARIYLAQGRCADAEKTLIAMSPQATSGNRVTRQLEINLLLAAAMAGQNRSPEAFEFIKTCLALAEPEGYIRAFIDFGEPARDLLAAYLRSDAAAHKLFAQKVLAAFSPLKGTGAPGPQPDGLIDPLSERELEVLHLMAQGRTNLEISRHLVVARGTIKAHAANIFRKLDVGNRTEAVARARQLGLLP